MDLPACLRRLDPGADRLARLVRLYACGVLPCLALVLLVMEWPRADGLHDVAGATFGHDLSQVWVAGRTALAGHPAQVYDVGLHHWHLRETFGPNAALFAWHYPPVFLLPAALLACLPYAWAVAAWAAGSLLLVTGALRAILGGWRPALVALAFPTVADALAYGQNGLLTASLLGFGLCLVERRPWAAGTLIGLVCYKPQLAALVPVVLLCGGCWRVAVASGVSALAMAVASCAVFGIAPWLGFVHGLSDTNADIFTQAWAGLSLNASAFGAVRLLGGSIGAAWAAQACVAATALGLTLRIWHRPIRGASGAPLRNAVLLAVIPLVSPYVPVYDLAVLVPAGAYFIVGQRTAGGIGSGARLALGPLFVLAYDPGHLAAATHVPAGFLLAAAVFALAARAAWGCGALPAGVPVPAPRPNATAGRLAAPGAA